MVLCRDNDAEHVIVSWTATVEGRGEQFVGDFELTTHPPASAFELYDRVTSQVGSYAALDRARWLPEWGDTIRAVMGRWRLALAGRLRPVEERSADAHRTPAFASPITGRRSACRTADGSGSGLAVRIRGRAGPDPQGRGTAIPRPATIGCISWLCAKQTPVDKHIPCGTAGSSG